MTYKTVSRNFQRWSVVSDNYTKERSHPIAYEYKIDFSLPLYFAQDFIDGLSVVCSNCKHTSNVSLEYVKKNFSLDTKFHIIYSTLKNKYPCKICKHHKNIIYIIKKKLSKQEVELTINRQTSGIIIKEQAQNRRELANKKYTGAQTKIRTKKNNVKI